MKFPNHEPHDHVEEKGIRHWPRKVRQYLRRMYESLKFKKMSQGSCNIVRSMSWPRGENWRRTHPKSLNKSHKK